MVAVPHDLFQSRLARVTRPAPRLQRIVGRGANQVVGLGPHCEDGSQVTERDGRAGQVLTEQVHGSQGAGRPRQHLPHRRVVADGSTALTTARPRIPVPLV